MGVSEAKAVRRANVFIMDASVDRINFGVVGVAAKSRRTDWSGKSQLSITFYIYCWWITVRPVGGLYYAE